MGFDEQTNNKQNAFKSVSFECKIEILSITLFKLNNVHNLEINDSDSQYKDVWNKFILDDNNVFMKNDDDDDDDDDNEQYLICKKEDFIRMNILKSLDLSDEKQKEYLMNSVHSMNESLRVLRKEKEQNTKMLKQLQTMMHSMQKNMKAMKTEIDNVTKTKNKENENENFIKRLKKDKAKRDKEKNKKKRKKESVIVIAPKAKSLSAKQQLFKTWMDMVVHLPQYFELFVDAGYEDLTYVENMQLTEQDLIQIGIDKKGHRQKILQEIKKMKPKKKNVIITGNDMNVVNNMSVVDPMNGLDDNFNKAEVDGMGDDLYLDVDAQNDADDSGW